MEMKLKKLGFTKQAVRIETLGKLFRDKISPLNIRLPKRYSSNLRGPRYSAPEKALQSFYKPSRGFGSLGDEIIDLTIARDLNYPINRYLGAGEGFKAFRQIEGMKKLKKKPEAQRAFNYVAGMHEQAERAAVIKKDINPFFNHYSPSVILKEHNILRGLKTKNTQSAKLVQNAFGKAREMGEEPVLQDFIKGYKHGRSPRLSRHAIKRVGEAYRRDWLDMFGNKLK